MPFYGKQTLVRTYRTWNGRKRKSLNPYIEVAYGKAFLTELELTIGQGGRHKTSSTSRVACSSQEQKDNPSTSQTQLPSIVDDKKSICQDPSSSRSETSKDLNPTIKQKPQGGGKSPSQRQDAGLPPGFTLRQGKRRQGKLRGSLSTLQPVSSSGSTSQSRDKKQRQLPHHEDAVTIELKVDSKVKCTNASLQPVNSARSTSQSSDQKQRQPPHQEVAAASKEFKVDPKVGGTSAQMAEVKKSRSSGAQTMKGMKVAPSGGEESLKTSSQTRGRIVNPVPSRSKSQWKICDGQQSIKDDLPQSQKAVVQHSERNSLKRQGKSKLTSKTKVSLHGRGHDGKFKRFLKDDNLSLQAQQKKAKRVSARSVSVRSSTTKLQQNDQSSRATLAKISDTGSKQIIPKQLERQPTTGGKQRKPMKSGKQGNPVEGALTDGKSPTDAVSSIESTNGQGESSSPVNGGSSSMQDSGLQNTDKDEVFELCKIKPLKELPEAMEDEATDCFKLESSHDKSNVPKPDQMTHKMQRSHFRKRKNPYPEQRRKNTRQRFELTLTDKAESERDNNLRKWAMSGPEDAGTANQAMSSSGLAGQVPTPTSHKVTAVASRKSLRLRQRARKLYQSPETSRLLEVPPSNSIALDPSSDLSGKRLSIKLFQMSDSPRRSSNQEPDQDLDVLPSDTESVEGKGQQQCSTQDFVAAIDLKSNKELSTVQENDSIIHNDQDYNDDAISPFSLRNTSDREPPTESASTSDLAKGDSVPSSESVYDENLWNLAVTTDIKNVPLLQDDEERKSPQRSDAKLKTPDSCGKSGLHTCTFASEEDIFQETMPLGCLSEHLKQDTDIEDESGGADVVDDEAVNDNSIVNESVEDEGHSSSPTCLPGLSHLRRHPATDLPVQQNAATTSPVFQQTKQYGSKGKKPPGRNPRLKKASKKPNNKDGQSENFNSPNQEPVKELDVLPKSSQSEDEEGSAVNLEEEPGEVEKLPASITVSDTRRRQRGQAPRVRTAAERKEVWTNVHEAKMKDSGPAAEEGAVKPAQDHHQPITEERNSTAIGSHAVTLRTVHGPVSRARKRGQREDQVRGQSGWEESLRQRPATISKFQAGDSSPTKSSKKPEAKSEKRRWQMQSPKSASSPQKTVTHARHQPSPQKPFRDVMQPPPAKKLKLSEDYPGQPQDPVDQETKNAVLPTSESLNILQDRYLYGEIVWGKMKGFNWWPGLVLHHYTCRKEPAPSDACWINWFGDNKFSKLNLNQVALFHEFPAHFSKSTFLHTALYRKAVFHGLSLASRRAGKAFSADPNPFLVDQPKRSRQYSTAWTAFYNLCHEMITWASDGFEPSGPEGIKPSQDEQQLPARPRSPSPPPSPRMSTFTKRTSRLKGTWNDTRDTVMEDVRNGLKDIKEVCLGCGSSNLTSEHPFFVGGLCEVCRVEFIEMVYVFDEDGYQCFCCICAEGKDIVLCDQTDCYRSFCYDCLDYLVGPGTVQKVLAKEHWSCYLCDPESTPAGLLACRSDWPQKLLLLFQRDNDHTYSPLRSYPPVEMAERRPIRVLSLFDGIGTGMLALKELGVKVDCYLASEINEEAIRVSTVRHDGVIQQLDDVRQITELEIRTLGPFDLVIGGSPCNDLSIANPARKGLFEGTGRLFFDFYRLLSAVRPPEDSDRPFFWLFENVVGMAHQDKMDISRFLECDPVVVDAKDVSPAHRARYFWGNLPGMNRPNVATNNNHLHLQDCLEPNCNRQAQFSKVRTVTSKLNSVKQKNERVHPVLMNGQEDTLWSTEMERIFGFPEHYTDIANMSRTSRHKLIGQAWSVPVIKHLLAPLKEYFACETHQ